jgi:hypothetical protein
LACVTEESVILIQQELPNNAIIGLAFAPERFPARKKLTERSRPSISASARHRIPGDQTMRYLAPFSGLLMLLTGCQHIQLRHHTERQASTLTELNYHIVLDNLAMLHCNSDLMPFYLYPNAGITNVQLTGMSNAGMNWDLLSAAGKPTNWFLDKVTYTPLQATDLTVEQWGTQPTSNPEELMLMRCVYLQALGCPCHDAECPERLAAFFSHDPDILSNVQPGWLHTGPHPPRSAVFVGHYGHNYAWVTEDGVNGLTKLTLAILDIATAQPPFYHDPDQVAVVGLEAKAKALADLLKSLDVKNPPATAESIKNELNIVLDRLAQAEAKMREKDSQPGKAASSHIPIARKPAGMQMAPAVLPNPQ